MSKRKPSSNRVSTAKRVFDPRHSFAPAICDNDTGKGRICSDWLGEYEVTRPNIAKFHCKACRKTYKYIIDADGNVDRSVTTDVTVSEHISVVVTDIDASN